jgi:ActR/RegA family two-component response regulator
VSDDKAKIARLIGYLTAFSEEKIRQRLSNPEELTSYHKDEVENINKILKELNANISVVCNNKR